MPEIVREIGASLHFSGGPEVSPFVQVVASNHHEAKPGDRLLRITGDVSAETLESILRWAVGAPKLAPKVLPAEEAPRYMDLMEHL